MYEISDEYSTAKIKIFVSHQKFSRRVKIAMPGWMNGYMKSVRWCLWVWDCPVACVSMHSFWSMCVCDCLWGESIELESSKPPAAAGTSARSAEPIRAQSPWPWRIRLLGDLFMESWGGAGTKAAISPHSPLIPPASPHPSGFDILDPHMGKSPPPRSVIPRIMTEKWWT